jgi:hypothetical protein
LRPLIAEIFDERFRPDPKGGGNLHELDNVQATLAEFVLGDKRLRSAKLLSELDLGKPRFLPGFRDQLSEALILACESRSCHGVWSKWARIKLPFWDKPKTGYTSKSGA